MPRVLLSPFASSLLLSLKYDNPHAPGLTFPRDLDDMARRRAVARILPYVHSLDRSLGNADSLSAAMPFVSLNRPRCTKAMTEFASSLLGWASIVIVRLSSMAVTKDYCVLFTPSLFLLELRKVKTHNFREFIRVSRNHHFVSGAIFGLVRLTITIGLYEMVWPFFFSFHKNIFVSFLRDYQKPSWPLESGQLS